MSVDFGALKDIFKFLDHKMLVSVRDATFLDTKLFDPQGVVSHARRKPERRKRGRVPASTKQSGYYRSCFPQRGYQYHIEVSIQETDNNFFVADRLLRC